jgi:hypothetical protein
MSYVQSMTSPSYREECGGNMSIDIVPVQRKIEVNAGKSERTALAAKILLQ